MGYAIAVLVTAFIVFWVSMYYHAMVLDRLRSTWTAIHTEYRIGVLKAEQIPQEIIARMKL
jgi:hypothetical protein